jgi:hypothetical protein
MSNGRFLNYYWQIRALLNEQTPCLAPHHPGYKICEAYDVEYTGTFQASIIFNDDSILIARFSLRATEAIEEYNYAYQYLNPQGVRIFRYDDAPHHPELSTHPHHIHRGAEPLKGERDIARPLDIPQVNFAAVFAKIIDQYIAK